ncbi:MAG: hypothetical protein ACRDHC_12415, partial [Actinomycetota bacterium]
MNERKARPSLGGRLLARYALTVVAILAGLAFVLDRTLESIFLDDLTESLAGEAEAVQAALPDDAADLQERVRALGADLDVRIT